MTDRAKQFLDPAKIYLPASLLVGAFVIAWSLADFKHSMEDNVNTMNQRIKALEDKVDDDRFTLSDAKFWAYEMERVNVTNRVNFPQPRSYKMKNRN